jgi:trans-aconitate 2-methyltransferase
MQVPPLSGPSITDLGCGNGPVGPILRTRFPEAKIIGLDSSPAMLKEARKTKAYDALTKGDIAKWQPDQPQHLIYSNAALHWVPDHASLLPRLIAQLAPGGTLAVQVPHQNPAPSHQTWLALVEQHFPGRFDPSNSPGIPDATATYDILDGLGKVTVWETEYLQRLEPVTDAHPVRLFTSSTFARPVLSVLDPDEQAHLARQYDAAMEQAYPRRADGSVLFPFRRLFYTVSRAA